MLQRLRESLTLALLALLPLHALLVTVGTRLIEGPGHAPMGLLAIWKESLLGLIVCVAIVECLMSEKRKVKREKWFDVIDILIFLLLCLTAFITASLSLFSFHFSLPATVLGFKYDFVPLIAFVILRRVPWSEEFMKRAVTVLLGVGALVAAYGILTFWLPQSFFTWLGYSDLHSLYVADGPLAAFQYIGGSSVRRIQGTMSGPNQFGLWLLIPWGIGIAALFRRTARHVWFTVCCLALIDFAFLFTFSRSAWIGATVIAVLGAGSLLSRVNFWRVTAALGVVAVIAGVIASLLMPSVFLRVASSRDHFLKPMEAVRSIIAHPLGQGLGTAGPASNRVSDTCVTLDAGSDASWAKDRPDLCVFVGDTKVQPLDRECTCPFIPENWYLQIGVELGVLGLLLYLSLIVAVLSCLAVKREKRKEKSDAVIFHFSLFTFLFFLAISIAALFLHAWEDAAVAYTGWMLIAATDGLRVRNRGNRPQ